MYLYTEREINNLKTELYMAKAELRHMEHRLAKANAELLETTMWVRTYKSAYEQNLQKCEHLIKANEELKLRNKCLETSLRAFKSIINALQRKGA
jgi:chromosome segregation ATPase